MKKDKKKEVKPYVKTSTTIAKAKTKTFSPTSMKLITYGLYKLAYSFNIEKYKSLCKDSDLEHVIFTKMFQKNDGSFELEERSLD